MEEVRQCNVEDVFAQEDIADVSEQLSDNNDKMFTPRLLLVIEKRKRDAELELAIQGERTGCGGLQC